jgi:uncharacterized protein YigE (DUF2233 family)
MPRRLVALIVLLPALLAVPAAADGPCRAHDFEGRAYTVCTIDLERHDLRLMWRDGLGLPYGGFARLPRQLDGQPLVFAMNAGMYRHDLSPVGLHVEGGRTLSPVSTADGPGNFHMKPNGVFYIAGGRAGVATTEAFLARAPAAEIATQSGPMLVIDGALHPRFLPHSTSLRRRNGVGVVDGRTAVFAISEGTVTFHDFARLFRDSLGVANALYLDGTMSSLFAPDLGRADAIRPMGPILAAYARR